MGSMRANNGMAISAEPKPVIPRMIKAVIRMANALISWIGDNVSNIDFMAVNNLIDKPIL
jgi:hypothetical protein